MFILRLLLGADVEFAAVEEKVDVEVAWFCGRQDFARNR